MNCHCHPKYTLFSTQKWVYQSNIYDTIHLLFLQAEAGRKSVLFDTKSSLPNSKTCCGKLLIVFPLPVLRFFLRSIGCIMLQTLVGVGLLCGQSGHSWPLPPQFLPPGTDEWISAPNSGQACQFCERSANLQVSIFPAAACIAAC